jgi:hypothetical protein
VNILYISYGLFFLMYIPNNHHHVKVSLHSTNEVEIKIYSKLEQQRNQRVRYEVTMLTPHCLDACSREAFMDFVRIRSRVGINCGWSLRKVVEAYTADFDDFVKILEESPQDIAENMICLMGCTLKSSIRRSVVGACPSKEMEKIIELIAKMQVRVVGSVVLARLEEFILRAIHITASRMAINDSAACEIATFAQERLESMGVFSTAAYSYQWHCLKHYFYSHIMLEHKIIAPSWFWTDVMGTLAAGLAMSVAVLLAWIAQKYSNESLYTLSIALILGYMIKDRIKEWVKRKGATMFKLPNRMMNLQLLNSTTVAMADEWYDITEVRSECCLKEFKITRDLQMFDRGYDFTTSNAAGHAQLVQVIRMNLSIFRERIPSTHDSYVVIETGVPKALECKLMYPIKFKLRISLLKNNYHRPRYSTSTSDAEASVKNSIFEQEYVANLDIDGLKL